jgi:hypothetical protein
VVFSGKIPGGHYRFYIVLAPTRKLVGGEGQGSDSDDISSVMPQK